MENENREHTRVVVDYTISGNPNWKPPKWETSFLIEIKISARCAVNDVCKNDMFSANFFYGKPIVLENFDSKGVMITTDRDFQS